MSRLSIFFFGIPTFSKFAHNSATISLLHHKIIIILMNSWQFYIFSWVVLTNSFLFYCANYKLFELKPSFSTFKIWSANTFSCFSDVASSLIFRLIFVFKSTLEKLQSFINQSFIDFKSSWSTWTLAHVSYLRRLKIWLHSSCLVLGFHTASTIDVAVLIIYYFSLIVYLLTSWIDLIRYYNWRLIL